MHNYDYMSTAFPEKVSGKILICGIRKKTTSGFLWNGSTYTCVAAKSLKLGRILEFCGWKTVGLKPIVMG